jgi:hypothetical protein
MESFMQLLKSHLVIGAALICTSQFIWAQEPQTGQNPNDNQQAGEHHRGPPPEAYTACEGKAAGVAASFINHRGDTINGVCQADQAGKLFIRRERPQQ